MNATQKQFSLNRAASRQQRPINYSFILLMLLFSSTFCVAEPSESEIPKEVVVRERTKVGLYRQGKYVRLVELDAGRTLNVLRLEPSYFVVGVDEGEAKLDKYNTELYHTNAPLLRNIFAKVDQGAPKTNSPTATTGWPAWYYEHAKKELKHYTEVKRQYVGEDLETIEDLISAAKSVITAYESGDKDKALQLGKTHELLLKKATEPTKINAYRYNGTLKENVIVPVTFDIYSGGEDFYLKVGDGTFSTVASFPDDGLSKFIDDMERLKTWSNTCRTEKLNTSKELAANGGVTLTFVAYDDGQMCYVSMDVRGKSRESAILESQKVRLAPMNFWRLYYRLLQANKIIHDWKKEQDAAKRLK